MSNSELGYAILAAFVLGLFFGASLGYSEGYFSGYEAAMDTLPVK